MNNLRRFLPLSRKHIGVGIAACLAAFVWAAYAAPSELNGPDTQQQLRNVLQECPRGGEEVMPSFFNCLREKLTPLIAQTGVRSLMDDLEELSVGERIEGPDSSIACHDVAHIVGEVGVTADEEGARNTLSQCSNACGYGCFHGVLLGLLRLDPTVAQDPSPLCSSFEESAFPGQQLTACHHGLGHGFADFAGRDIDSALLLCDRLRDTRAQQECATGVLMEIIDSPTLQQEPFTLPSDIPAFCASFPSGYDLVCYSAAGGYEYKRSGDTQAAFALCASLAGELDERCSVGLGSDLHFLLQGDVERISRECAVGLPSQERSCIEGALVSGLVNDPSGSLGAKLCSLASEDIREECTRSLIDDLTQLGGEEASRALCATLPADMRIFCQL